MQKKTESNKYKKSLMTRRSMVQIIYKNYFAKLNSIEEIYEEEDFLLILDDELFKKYIKIILEDWENTYDKLKVFLIFESSWNKASICMQSILRCAYYEIIDNINESKLIINDYLNIANMFCASEKRAINKILDQIYKGMLD